MNGDSGCSGRYALTQEHTKVRGERGVLSEQVSDLEDVWKRQRSHLVAQVCGGTAPSTVGSILLNAEC